MTRYLVEVFSSAEGDTVKEKEFKTHAAARKFAIQASLKTKSHEYVFLYIRKDGEHIMDREEYYRGTQGDTEYDIV